MLNTKPTRTLHALTPLRRLYAALLLAALLTAGMAGWLLWPAELAQAQTTDYDTDNDGLIEVSGMAQLDAIRWDLDGDGASSNDGYSTAFPNAADGMGCPTTGCQGYELAADLDFDTNGNSSADSGDAYWNGGHGWVPIGTDTDALSAIFEGNGRVISNLYIDSDPGKHAAATGYPRYPGPVGLFQEIGSGGVVRNVGLENVAVSRLYPCYDKCADGHLGTLAGVNHGTISGSWSTGVVSNVATYAGQFPGPAGPAIYAVRAGGLVGLAGSSSVIANSYSAAQVSALSDWPADVGAKAGGLVGQNSGSIIASYAAGSVSSSQVELSFQNVGGLVGHNSGPVTASYAAGVVSGGGGLVGRATGNAAVSDSYFDTTASGQSSSAGGVGKTTAELQGTTETSTQQNYTPYTGIYADWNVDLDGDGNGDDPWDFGTASQYPALSGLGVSEQRSHAPIPVPVIDYDSDDDGLIEVSTAYQLYALKRDRNGDGSLSRPDEYDWWIEHPIEYRIAFPNAPAGMSCPASGCVGYELVTDLDLHPMTPSHPYVKRVNSEKDGYAAIFDGNGHTISNFHDNDSMGLLSYGLFKVVGAKGVIRNLRMTSVDSGGWRWAGAVAGINYGTISNVHVSGVAWTVGANDTGVGMLVGLNAATGIITDSSSAGASVGMIDGNPGRYVGGLVGRNEGSIRSSYSTANAYAIATDDMGGLVGYNAASGSIRASYATGDVWSGNWERRVIYDRSHRRIRHSHYLGGLVGRNAGEITASYSTGRASGGVDNYAESVGGLVGHNAGGTVTDSYWDTQTSGWATSEGGAGKTTAQLQSPWRYEGIYANWNVDLDGDDSADDPWDFGSATEYPTLKAADWQQSARQLLDAPTYAVTPHQARVIEGGTARLTVTLNKAAPAGGVEFTVTPTYGGAVTAEEVGSIVSPATVAEGDTTVNIDIPTVNDYLDEPRHRTFTVTVAATAGWRAAGEGRDTATVTIRDDDASGIRLITGVSRLGEPLRVAEGETATYRMSLASQPAADVTVTPTSDDPGAVAVSPASYTWKPADWRTLVTFTVSGVADEDTDDERVVIRHQASSQDQRFNKYVGSVTVAVSDNTLTEEQQGLDSPGATGSSGDYADLIAQMYQWRNGPEAQQWGKAHTDRWDRALLAFGETVADATLTPMTAAEAQGYADQSWGERWAPVAAALRQIEAAAQQPTNRAPTVSAAIGDATIVNESGAEQVSLSGVFSDADGDSLTVTAASSDNAVATVSVAADHSSLTVGAQARGTATITATANDGKGGTVSDAFTVTVKAAPVVASALADVPGLEVAATQDVSLSGVFSDADGDSLIITAESSDDAVATVAVVTGGSNLTLTGVAEGTAAITVTAQDSDGNRASDGFDVTVGGKYAALIAKMYQWRNGPEAQQWGKAHTDRWDRALLAFGETVADATLTPMTAAEAQGYADQSWGERWVPVAGALREIEAAAQQPANRAPTVSAAIADATIVNESGTEQVSLSGVFSDADNDGLTVTAGSSDEAVATVSVSSDHSSLRVSARSRGTATITVTASDGRGGTVTVTITVTVKAAPVVASAIGDISGMERLTAQEISLSGVFRDADGDALTITAVSSDDDVALAVTGEDNELTVYAQAEGSATITVTAQDSDGNTVSDKFEVSVAAPQQQEQQGTPNQAPTVASAIADATIANESGTKQISLSGVFDDADGDSLTVTAVSSDQAKATVSVSSDHSTLTVAAQARGTAIITVTANDGNGGTVSDAFTVTVKAAPLVASAISDVSGLEAGESRQVFLSGVFSDADGDSLTITAASSDDAIATVTVASDGSRLTLSGVAEGTATVTVTAEDADGNRVSDEFAVSVEPKPEEKQDVETSDGAPTVSAPLSDLDLVVPTPQRVSLAGVFTDPDGDELRIGFVSSHYHIATGWIDGLTLTMVGISTGTATITVTAEDPDGNTVSDSFEVSVRSAS